MWRMIGKDLLILVHSRPARGWHGRAMAGVTISAGLADANAGRLLHCPGPDEAANCSRQDKGSREVMRGAGGVRCEV